MKMAGSLNKVMLIGNLGADADVRKTQSGDSVATLSIATSESWKDQSGQRQDRTEWHRVVLFGRIADIAGQYLRKGSKVLIEGQLRTRKWTNQQGQDQYTTEVVVSGFGGNMTMLDSAPQGGGQGGYNQGNASNQGFGGGQHQQPNQGFGGSQSSGNDAFGSASATSSPQAGGMADLDDDIPF